MPNRLARETSPYLLQHADNPVDWYPWGEEAFARARAEDRPVLLSVGYAACHWCHVMERESFEDPATAVLMNAGYVCVKVDREERPDVDQVYMAAVQAMTGHGGWPMTVFLTPDGTPFVAGTYFPPEDRHGIPSFRRVLESVRDAWAARRGDVLRTAASLQAMYARVEQGAGADGGEVTVRTLERAVRGVVARVDPERGGLAGAPKFPPTMAMEYLLTQWSRTGGPNGGDPELLEVPLATFRAMARGGLYDQVGGGFARYSVDAEWLVPHFEKMLYDNALLVRHGVHLWQATGGPGDGNREVRRVAEETLDWAARELTAPNGGFYSTLDADSEGHEGRFYVWDAAELDAVLGADAEAVKAYYEVRPGGNFEGRSILHVDRDRPWAAEEGPDAALAAAVRRAKPLLLAARARRVRPARDEKLLASWNGLMLRAVAEAALAFGRPADRAAALACGEFLAGTLVDARTGRVMRVHAAAPDGTPVTKVGGFLDDHAAVGLGFLALHALTRDGRWLDLAERVAEACVTWFWDEAAGAFYDTAHDAERLVTRPRDATDNAVPSGTSLACELLLLLAEAVGAARGREGWRAVAARAVAPFAEPMARHAPFFGQLLQAADQLVHGGTTVALVGAEGPAMDALAATLGGTYGPARVAGGEPVGAVPGTEAGSTASSTARTPPTGAQAAAYVCRHSTCGPPAVTPAALAAQLGGG